MYNYVSHPKDIETLGIVFVYLLFSPFMYRHMQRCQTIDNILHAYSALPLLAVYKPYQKRRAPILSVFYRLYICVRSSPIGKPCVKSFSTYSVFKVHPQSGDFYPPTSGAFWIFKVFSVSVVSVPLTVAIIYLIISNMSIDNCKIPVFGLPTLSHYSKKRDKGVYFTRNFRLKIHFSS